MVDAPSRSPPQEVVHERAGYAHEVDAVVFVEALVLGGHGALEHVGAHLVDGHRLLVLQVELGQEGGAIAGVDARLLAVRERVAVLHAGQVFRPVVDDVQDALDAAVADEAHGRHGDKGAPRDGMSALLTLFPPYLHDSTILP